jgi:hypothetical protein
MGEGRRRRHVEPTEDWEQLELLCRWPEHVAYEQIRPLVLFGLPVAERAEETDSSERTLYRRISRFESEGMASSPPNARSGAPCRPRCAGSSSISRRSILRCALTRSPPSAT